MTQQRQPAYTVRLEEKHWDALNALPRQSQQQDAINFLTGYLPYTPTVRIPTRLKTLKGPLYRGVWQFDIDDNYRIHYTVDETARTVNIEYIGPHPDWRKARGGRRITN